MSRIASNEATPEELAITEEQVRHLGRLIARAKGQGLEPTADEEAVLELTRGEADEMIDELQAQLERPS